MIISLTPEQESKFPEYAKRWTAIGLSTEPADRPKAEQAIKKCYKKARLAVPKKIIWCDSPFSQALTRAILIGLKNESVGEAVRISVRASVWDSVKTSVAASIWGSVANSAKVSVWDSISGSIRESVSDSVAASVKRSVWDSISGSISDSVRDSVKRSVYDSACISVRNSLWESVSDPVWKSVGDVVKNSIWDSVTVPIKNSIESSLSESVMELVTNSESVPVLWDSVMDSVGGSHEAAWLSLYSFMRNELGLIEQTERITGFLELVLHCGWILPCKEICFASERHNVLKRDERGRLHCIDGPAISYPDGWNIYAIHGVRVPEYVITSPHEITVKKIESQSNAEIRRVMIDIYGPNRYMEDSGATLIHEDSYGKLYRKDLANDEPIVMVKVVNSTPEPNGTFKEYFLRVPPDTKTAHEAVAWTFGKEDKAYNPALET